MGGGRESANAELRTGFLGSDGGASADAAAGAGGGKPPGEHDWPSAPSRAGVAGAPSEFSGSRPSTGALH